MRKSSLVPGICMQRPVRLTQIEMTSFFSFSGTGMQKIIFVLLYKCQLYPVLDTEISEDDDDADLATLTCIENDI